MTVSACNGLLDCGAGNCGSCATDFTRHENHLQLLGDGGGYLGLAVTIVGIAFSQNYSVERDVRIESGDSVDIHEYRFTFRDVKEVTGPELAWRAGDYRRNARWQAGNGAVRGKTLSQHCRVDDDRSGN
ncbi:cytochrome c-type biogenesis CcmF C-terminal domain-containing protein [Escherichia coli]